MKDIAAQSQQNTRLRSPLHQSEAKKYHVLITTATPHAAIKIPPDRFCLRAEKCLKKLHNPRCPVHAFYKEVLLHFELTPIYHFFIRIFPGMTIIVLAI